MGKASIALRAKTVLVSLMQKSQAHATVYSLLTSALKSKSVDFSKITAQIDGMIDVLGKEQADGRQAEGLLRRGVHEERGGEEGDGGEALEPRRLHRGDVRDGRHAEERDRDALGRDQGPR